MRASIVYSLLVFTAISLAAAQNPVTRPTPSPTISSAATTTSLDIPPSPTESTGCYLHGDHYHCEGDAEGSEHHDEEGHEDETEEYGETLANGCVQHGTHWHCPAGVSAPCEAVLGDYNLGLHVGAVFILLVASGVGVFTPVIFGQRRSTSSVASHVFFALRHFGTGVILATAFIHLLMHAFVMFANECLGHLAYEAVAPAIAMAALMIIFAIDLIAIRLIGKKATVVSASGPPSPSTAADVNEKPAASHTHDFSDVDSNILIASEGSRRAKWEVELLEAGICFHSIMIGVTLGAQGGTGFIPTFCAIIFHQLFEGLGLGARIGRLRFETATSWRKWAMCLVYTLITPIGIAIGIAVRQNFNLSGKATIYSVGILDSISAGILLYAGIAQLLVGDWLAGEMRTASTSKVAVAGLSLFLGLFSMSLIGKWA